MHVSEINLSTEEQTVFDKFLFSDSATLTRAEFNLLRCKGLLKGSIDGESDWFDNLPAKGICSLSRTGKDLRAYQYKEKCFQKRDSFRYWLPIVLSNLIAIAALTVAILK